MSKKGADADALQKAFRKKAMELSSRPPIPEMPKPKRKFKELNEAYDVLKDEQKRAAYDRFGHAAFENGHGGGARRRRFRCRRLCRYLRRDVRRLHGPARWRPGPRPAVRTCASTWKSRSRKLSTASRPPSACRAPIPCDDCHGTGGEKGAQPITCPACHGHGKVRATQGFFTIERTCQHCGGAGKVIEKPCKTCHGAGRTAREKTLQVNVPAGVEEGHPHPPGRRRRSRH